MYKEPTNAELFQAFVLGYDLKEQQRAEICDKISELTNIPAEELMKAEASTKQLADWLEKQDGYPEIADGGETDVREYVAQDRRPAKDQFVDWFGEASKVDLTADKDGFVSLERFFSKDI